ncbi:MAG: hypothetical protein AVDCRST_MAG50-1740 [uncultured Acidimicrobiales bacterium]|uniref:Mycothiol-dependent maleylpyruvate isomerase metal-binding domain-containing protein n=1 Tax=uncultured Acidimicrobiales bacterium TaxID=310071 RepID=A0A6J4I429_9ACTN|nr:MAG: hypothetical protein AVDCRST_MAG50-1740 [uncultured Acidimicrobiales bacterium]
MSEISERYRKVAGQLTERVTAVPDGAWDNPAPPEGWKARDVIGHLVEWIPQFFFGTWDVEAAPAPSAHDDPVAAWLWLDGTIQAALDDPEIAGRERDTRMGRSAFEQTFDMIGTTDVFMHTWDLARSTGLDETLDPDEVHKFVEGMEPMDEALRSSGHYGPRVPVPDDADEQTRLIAFIGRQP